MGPLDPRRGSRGQFSCSTHRLSFNHRPAMILSSVSDLISATPKRVLFMAFPVR